MNTRRGGRRGSRTSTDTNGRVPRNATMSAVDPAEEMLVQVHTPMNFAALCKNFTALGGKPFYGTEDILGVQMWLRTCERIFGDLRLEDAEKRLLASRQLQKSAMDWWDSETASTPEGEFSWAQFKEVFEAQFIPEAGRTQLFRSFIDLKQGDMTVSQYEHKFNALSRFGLGLIDTPLKKNEMFVNGMRPEFHREMTNHLMGTFTNIISMALRFEALDIKEGVQKGVVPAISAKPLSVIPVEGKPNFKRKFKGKKQGAGKKPEDGAPAQKKQTNLANILCFKCNKMGHFANHCPIATCFNCGQPGHMKNECHFPKKGSQGQTFTIEEIPSTSSDKKGKQVLQGTLSIYDIPVRVLFDTGASHSFISYDLMDKLNLKYVIISNPLCVSNPIGGPTNLDTVCLNVPISCRNHLFPFDLFVLGFMGFGVLLGMDWLSKFKAILDCGRRLVRVSDAGDVGVDISCEEPKKLMSSFLYSLEVTKAELGDVPVVRDFIDIFDEVQGLPPHREVEFRIDLVPGTYCTTITKDGSKREEGVRKADL